MNTIKKFTGIVLASALALAALSGCARSAGGTVTTDGSTSMKEVIGALGEAMAAMMVSGNAPNMPALFESVRFLTTAVASEMVYSQQSSLHQQALFSIALALFLIGCVLSAGRILGESAALLFTAGFAHALNSFFSALGSPGATLTVALYLYVSDPTPGAEEASFAIAAILMLLTLCVNLAAALIGRHFKKGKTL